jgi:hypothetical protein
MKDGFCKRDPTCRKEHLERWKSLLDAPPEPRFEATRVGVPNGVTSTGWKLDVVFPEPPIAADRSAIRFEVSGAAPSHVSQGVHDAGRDGSAAGALDYGFGTQYGFGLPQGSPAPHSPV